MRVPWWSYHDRLWLCRSLLVFPKLIPAVPLPWAFCIVVTASILLWNEEPVYTSVPAELYGNTDSHNGASVIALCINCEGSLNVVANSDLLLKIGCRLRLLTCVFGTPSYFIDQSSVAMCKICSKSGDQCDTMKNCAYRVTKNIRILKHTYMVF